MTGKQVKLLENIDESLEMLTKTSLSIFYCECNTKEDEEVAYESILETMKQLKQIKNHVLKSMKEGID